MAEEIAIFAKPKLRSVTLWFFFVVSIIAEALKQLGAILPETAWVAQGLSVCAWILRFKTMQPIIGPTPPAV